MRDRTHKTDKNMFQNKTFKLYNLMLKSNQQGI